MKKKLLKKIRHIDGQLPVMHYDAYPKEHMDQTDDNGQVLGYKPKIVRSHKAEYEVNHVRRMKRLVTAHGFENGVHIHIEWCEKQLKKELKIKMI